MADVIAKAVVDARPLFKVLALIFVREYDDNSVLTRTDLPHRPEVQDGYLRLFFGKPGALLAERCPFPEDKEL